MSGEHGCSHSTRRVGTSRSAGHADTLSTPQCEHKHFREPFDQMNGSYESSERRQRCVCLAGRSREEFAGLCEMFDSDTGCLWNHFWIDSQQKLLLRSAKAFCQCFTGWLTVHLSHGKDSDSALAQAFKCFVKSKLTSVTFVMHVHGLVVMINSVQRQKKSYIIISAHALFYFSNISSIWSRLSDLIKLN